MFRPVTLTAKYRNHFLSLIVQKQYSLFQLKQTSARKVQPNLTLSPPKNLHFSPLCLEKLFTDNENQHAYKILPEIAKVQAEFTAKSPVTTLEEFNELLGKNWRKSNATQIVDAFVTVKNVAVSHNINLSDRRFDNLVDGLMDHCEKLTDSELLALLSTLKEYPPCESSDSHNFHHVWSCLDDICCWKMQNWPKETLFTLADLWYHLHLARLSDFVRQVVFKLSHKPKHLSKNHLLYTFFYYNAIRSLDVSFEIESELAKRIHEFNIDELAVIAMGFFKSKSKVKLDPILSAMIAEICKNSDNVSEISLTAMLKVIRFSQRYNLVPLIPPMLDKLSQNIDKYSIMTAIHIALMGTTLQIKHEKSLKSCTDKILKNIQSVRLKDIERILLASSMFNIDTDLYSKSYEEIHKEERIREAVKYTRCLPSILNYLSFRKFYSYKLSDKLLNEDYIHEMFGKSPRNLPRDLFSLDVGLEIECPDYGGAKLSPNKRHRAARWLLDFIPAPDQPKRISLADKAFLHVVQHLAEAVGDRRLVRCEHVLPHFSKGDVVLCKDRKSAKFVEPFGFEDYIIGDVKKPSRGEEFEWFAVVVLTPALMVCDTGEALGSMVMKERQLRAIGFKPVLISAPHFDALSPSEKRIFLENALK